jgi:hypothetical protein
VCVCATYEKQNENAAHEDHQVGILTLPPPVPVAWLATPAHYAIMKVMHARSSSKIAEGEELFLAAVVAPNSDCARVCYSYKTSITLSAYVVHRACNAQSVLENKRHNAFFTSMDNHCCAASSLLHAPVQRATDPTYMLHVELCHMHAAQCPVSPVTRTTG